LRNDWLKRSWKLHCWTDRLVLHICKGPYRYSVPVDSLRHLRNQFGLSPIIELAYTAKTQLIGGSFGLPSRASVSKEEFQKIIKVIHSFNETVDGKIIPCPQWP